MYSYYLYRLKDDFVFSFWHRVLLHYKKKSHDFCFGWRGAKFIKESIKENSLDWALELKKNGSCFSISKKLSKKMFLTLISDKFFPSQRAHFYSPSTMIKRYCAGDDYFLRYHFSQKRKRKKRLKKEKCLNAWYVRGFARKFFPTYKIRKSASYYYVFGDYVERQGVVQDTKWFLDRDDENSEVLMFWWDDKEMREMQIRRRLDYHPHIHINFHKECNVVKKTGHMLWKLKRMYKDDNTRSKNGRLMMVFDKA